MYALSDVIESIVGSRPMGRGKNVMVRCPIHGDRDPSLSVNRDNGLWLCFACGAKGNLLRLAEVYGVSLDGDIVNRVISLNAEPEETMDFSEKAKDLTANLFIYQPQVVIDYIRGRNLLPGTLRHFSMGYDPEKDAIAVPYWDGDRVTGIKYRTADGKKYSQPGSHYGIYNIDHVRQKPFVVLCEGESDTHAAWSALTRLGISGIVVQEIGVGGLSGATTSSERWEVLAVDLMWAKRVVVIFDNDEPGKRGAQTAVSAIGEKAVSLSPTEGKDLSEHFANGGTLKQIGLLNELSNYTVAV